MLYSPKPSPPSTVARYSISSAFLVEASTSKRLEHMDFPADANQAELRTYPITRFQRMGYDTYQATELTLKWYGGSHAMFCMTEETIKEIFPGRAGAIFCDDLIQARQFKIPPGVCYPVPFYHNPPLTDVDRHASSYR